MNRAISRLPGYLCDSSDLSAVISAAIHERSPLTPKTET